MCRRAEREPSGFSLVEMLVVFGVVALLVAIALPVLSGAIRGSRLTKSLANARSIQQQFEHYASANGVYPHAWRGRMPPETMEDVGFEVPWYPPGWVTATNHYWDLSTRWPGLIADPESWPAQLDTWRSPGHRAELPDAPTGTPDPPGADPAEFVSYAYAHAFLGDPALWTRQSGRDWTLARATRPAEVASPDAKVMLWDRHLGWAKGVPQREGHLDAPTPMAFADGHADALRPLDAGAGVPNVLNDGRDTRLHNTPRGVRGRDY